MKDNSGQTFQFKGHNLAFLKKRQHTDVTVFGDDELIIRIGDKSILQREYEFHVHLRELGFPIPELVECGEAEGKFYYSEKSFGKKHMGILFIEDCKSVAEKISVENFTILLEVAEQFAKAQIKCLDRNQNWNESFKSSFLHTTI